MRDAASDVPIDTLPEVAPADVPSPLRRAVDSVFAQPPRSVDSQPRCTRYFGHPNGPVVVHTNARCDDTMQTDSDFFYAFTRDGHAIPAREQELMMRAVFADSRLRGRPGEMCPEVRDTLGWPVTSWQGECPRESAASPAPQNSPNEGERKRSH